jgi:uncharacterized iron-regulated protein
MNHKLGLNILTMAALVLAAPSLSGCAFGPDVFFTPAPTPGTVSPAKTSLKDLNDFALFYTDRGQVTPRPTDVAEASAILKDFDVIFIGEEHRHPGNHIAQMALFRSLHERSPDMALSMEQFERDVQNVVDDFLAGKIGETPFRDKSRAWDNYVTSYRPLVEYARDFGLPVIAAEAPTMVVRCVGERGPEFLNTMKPEQRGWAAAELNLGDGPYKEKYMGFAAGNASHGENTNKDKTDKKAPSAAALRSFAAQVTRDDTMAESIYLHLQKNPGRKVVHLNGFFHTESFLGTAERLQLRDPKLKIAVVNPVHVQKDEILSVKPEDAKTGTFVLLIRETPKSYANDDELKASISKQMEFRGKNKCEL